MTRDVLDLGALAWQIGQAPRQPFSRSPLDDRSAVKDWLPARVPGDVRADLLAAGRLASLDTPAGLRAAEWVDDADWWYRTEVEGVERGMTAVIEADGIDYLSAVYLDGELVATHEGMFARQALVLPASIQEQRCHELAVRVWGGGALPRLPASRWRRAVRKLLTQLKLASEFYPDRMVTTKAQFSFGWDFSPRVLSAGIWDEVRLVRCCGAYVAHLQVDARPLDEAADCTRVHWQVKLFIERFGAERLRAAVELHTLDGEHVSLTRDTFDLGATHQATLAFDSSAVRRWWPWDQGEPRLHRLTVRLLSDDGVADEIAAVVGVRTVERCRFSGGQPWRFLVNGRHVFLRGANWVPPDILPGRVQDADYQRLIQQAQSAGVNFLRVWGGGLREKRVFWEQCNQRGILAMQEFPLACAFLDHYPRDQRYLALLQAEAQGIVRALCNHPSLFAWCGGNEISPQRERPTLRILERVLAEEDAARPWIPASPCEGDIHEWDVWHGGAPWQGLTRVRAPFMSEFGLQALPDSASIAEMFPLGPPPLDDASWEARKLQLAKLRHYAGPLHDDWVATIEATQRTQAAGLQAGIEGCRLRREGTGAAFPCGGVAFWQFNEPWPVVSWSVVDRRGRPKAAYEMLARSYQPLLVAARFERRAWQAGDVFQAEIWLVNDGPASWSGCAVEALLDGQLVYTWENVVVTAGSAHRVVSISLHLEHPPRALALSCRRSGALLAENRYDLGVYLPPRQPFLTWLLRRAVDLLLR